MKYTAQHGEDRWMEQNWAELGLPEVGTFCEVGACDGILLSNTYWLEHSKGWSGVLIEPEPRWGFMQKMRPKSTLLKIACGRTLAISLGQHPDCPSLSGELRLDVPRVLVPCLPLETCLRDLSSLDVLSIDTEGTELDVWATRGRFSPKLVIIEWDTQGLAASDQSGLIIERFRADGYSLRKTMDCNLIFTRD